jgi:hypothetical protein
MSVNYRIFVQLVDGTGHVWGQWDHEPVQGHLATSLWQPGMFVRDAAEVLVPAEAPAGAYQLKTGLYDPGTLQRLRIPGTGDDALVVGPITVSN